MELMETQTTQEVQIQPLYSVRSLLRLIVPMVVEQGLAMAVGAADTIMVTSVGEAAVSGIALVDSINNLMIQILAALATGGAVVAAQYLGRQQAEGARSAARQLLLVVTLVSVVLSVISVVFNGSLLRLIFGDVDARVMENAKVYFYLSASSYPFLAVYNAIAAMFRAMGNSKVSMMTALLMNIVNFGGNAVLIYVCGWGVAGAATASLLSRLLSAVVMLHLISNHQNAIWLDRSVKFDIKPDMAKRILAIGIPNGLENGMFQFGKLIVQSVVAGYGMVAITANAIAGSITSVVMVPGSAVGLAMITVVGQCMGAEDNSQAGKNVKRMLLMTYAGNIVLGLLLWLLAAELAGLFQLGPETIALAAQLLITAAITQVLFWPTAFPLSHALRATGDARFTMVVSVVSMWVFRVGCSYVLGIGMGMGVMGVWYAMYIDWVVRSAAFIWRWRSGKWKSKTVI